MWKLNTTEEISRRSEASAPATSFVPDMSSSPIPAALVKWGAGDRPTAWEWWRPEPLES
jgi:hypothetical protein